MSGKARCSETAKLHAGRDPDGMVKAILPEPQCPSCKLERDGYGGKYPLLPRSPGESSTGAKKIRRISGRIRSTPGRQVAIKRH